MNEYQYNIDTFISSHSFLFSQDRKWSIFRAMAILELLQNAGEHDNTYEAFISFAERTSNSVVATTDDVKGIEVVLQLW